MDLDYGWYLYYWNTKSIILVQERNMYICACVCLDYADHHVID